MVAPDGIHPDLEAAESRARGISLPQTRDHACGRFGSGHVQLGSTPKSCAKESASCTVPLAPSALCNRAETNPPRPDIKTGFV